MGAYHLIILDASNGPRRVDFRAESPDQAFLIARNEKDGVDVELWEGDRLLACMTKSIANVWRLGGAVSGCSDDRRAKPGTAAKAGRQFTPSASAA